MAPAPSSLKFSSPALSKPLANMCVQVDWVPDLEYPLGAEVGCSVPGPVRDEVGCVVVGGAARRSCARIGWTGTGTIGCVDGRRESAPGCSHHSVLTTDTENARSTSLRTAAQSPSPC